MINKTTLHAGKDCWTTPRSSPPPCHVGALVQMIGDDTVDDEDEDYDGDDDNNHIEKESQVKSSPLLSLDNPNQYFRHISITRGGRN